MRGIIAIVRAWCARPASPYDWERECPELRPDGDHHHVKVIRGAR